MAGSYEKRKLSGSTSGKQIKVTGNGTGSSVTVHTALASTDPTEWDEIWLYADNDSTSPVLLTIEFGGTTDVDNTIKVTVPAKGAAGDGLTPVIAGLILQNGLVVKAFAATANVIKLSGFIHRIS